MARLFGTDGVRGIANAHLNAELAYKLGRAAAQYFGREVKSPKIIIGRDTRLSGTMLESALAAGICSAGRQCPSSGRHPYTGCFLFDGKTGRQRWCCHFCLPQSL